MNGGKEKLAGDAKAYAAGGLFPDFDFRRCYSRSVNERVKLFDPQMLPVLTDMLLMASRGDDGFDKIYNIVKKLPD